MSSTTGQYTSVKRDGKIEFVKTVAGETTVVFKVKDIPTNKVFAEKLLANLNR